MNKENMLRFYDLYQDTYMSIAIKIISLLTRIQCVIYSSLH